MSDPRAAGIESETVCELAWNFVDDCTDRAAYVVHGSRSYDICERHAKHLVVKGYAVYTPEGSRFRG